MAEDPDYTMVPAAPTSEGQAGSSVFETNEAVLGQGVNLTPGTVISLPDGSAVEVGYQGATVAELLYAFGHMTPDQMRALQTQLLLLNYDTRSPGEVEWGVADPKSYDAYEKAIRASMRYNIPLPELLNGVEANGENMRRLAGRGGGGGGGGVRTRYIQHAADAEVEQGVLRGFQAALGRGPTKEEAEAFKAAFRQKETAAQPDTTGGGTFEVTGPAAPVVEAQKVAEETKPEDAASYKKLQAFGEMVRVLGGSSG